MKYDEIKLECPHCKDELDHDCHVSDSCLQRIEGPDDNITNFSNLKELWHCPICDNYFEVYYKFDKTVLLLRKEDG